MSYVTEIVWRLGFADVAFRVERSDDREHVCVRSLRYLSQYETFTFQTRRGSRINTDRFRKRAPKAQAFRGVRGHASPGAFLDFNPLKSPFLRFRVIRTGYWLVPFTLGEARQLGKFCFIY